MWRKTVMCAVPYGKLRAGHEYPVIEKGFDYFLIKRGGRTVYLPTNLVGEPERKQEEDERELTETA